MIFKYKFTIFTPCYNSEKTINRVFNSLINQSIDHSLFEWIVIDDASLDNTSKKIEKFKQIADFDIKHIVNKKNQMLIKNIKKAIDLAEGELLLELAHDDAMVENTLERFLSIWESFNKKEKENCASIVCLSQDQYGKPIGSDYPVNETFVDSLWYTLKLDKSKIGENWGVLNIKFMKKYYNVPDIIDKMKYIPESFFWNKMAFEMEKIKPKIYVINDRLRIYYIGHESLSSNIRAKYANGFEYESLFFINNYVYIQLKNNPKFYLKHLIKYALTSKFNGKTFIESFIKIENIFSKILYFIIYWPSQLLSHKYFNK